MLYKTFGRTGILVSALGMGISRFSPELYQTQSGREQCADIIVKAYEEGINYFDMAPTYCGWKSEEMMGMAIQKMKSKNPFYIATKTSSTQDPTADAVRRRLDTSLKRLGVSNITFYNMWGLLNYDQYLEVIKPGGPYEGALAAKKEGLIDHICFSAHCTGDEIVKILEDDLFDGITLGYNAINFKYREKGLLAAYKKGLGVAIMNPLYGGVIPQNPSKFEFIKNKKEQSLAQSGLLFNASQEAVSVVLSGMTTKEQILENASCFEEENLYQTEKINEIKNFVVKKFDSLCTGCNYCQGCPNNIKVNQLMLAYNQYVLMDYSKKEFHKYMNDVWRYPENAQFACAECGYCESKCTQHLPIINRIKEINQLAEDYLREITPELKDLFYVEKGQKLGIYASGPYAKRLIEMYEKAVGKIDFEIIFFDSDKKKWGKSAVVEKYLVHSPEEIEKSGVRKLIIASEAFYQEIYESIKHHEEKGIKLYRVKIR